MQFTHPLMLCTQATDMRKSFNGLIAQVKTYLKDKPDSGQVFVFINKRADRIKLLYWDGSGLWVLAKRLEQGKFCRPPQSRAKGEKLALKPEALEMLLSGIDLKDGLQRAWYEEPATQRLNK